MKIYIPIILMLLSSCQPSKIIHLWTAENNAPKKYNKILVLGVLPEADAELQQKMENHLVDDLRQLGYQAVAANKVFPAGTFVKGDTAKAKTALEGKGFDGILTVVLLDKNKQPYYVPGKVIENNKPGQHRSFDIYFNAVSEQIYAPGFYGTETKYVWENNFYDLGSKQMVYSARSRSFDFTSKTTLAHTYGQLMVYSLVKKKVLIAPAKED